MRTKKNKELCMELLEWLHCFSDSLEDKNDVLFLHIDVDVINQTIYTEVKVSCDDRELQRSKQKTA